MKHLVICIVAVLTFCGYVSASDNMISSDVMSGIFDKKTKKELKTVIFNAHLHCENCVKKVKENISFERGVKALEVSLEDKTIKVTYDASKTDEDKLKTAIEKLGYEVKVKKE